MELPVFDKTAVRSPRNHLAVKQQGKASVAGHVDLERLLAFSTKRAPVLDEQPAALVTRRRVRDPSRLLYLIAHRKPGIAARIRWRAEDALNLHMALAMQASHCDNEKQDVPGVHFSTRKIVVAGPRESNENSEQLADTGRCSG